MRYTELADEMVEKWGRVGQKAQKVRARYFRKHYCYLNYGSFCKLNFDDLFVVQGWYNYDPNVGNGRKALPSPEMEELINKYSMNSPHKGTKLSKEEIIHRVLFPLVNEGFKILEEGIALDPSDIDIIYLYGYGWPAFKGEYNTIAIQYVCVS